MRGSTMPFTSLYKNKRAAQTASTMYLLVHPYHPLLLLSILILSDYGFSHRFSFQALLPPFSVSFFRLLSHDFVYICLFFLSHSLLPAGCLTVDLEPRPASTTLSIPTGRPCHRYPGSSAKSPRSMSPSANQPATPPQQLAREENHRRQQPPTRPPPQPTRRRMPMSRRGSGGAFQLSTFHLPHPGSRGTPPPPEL